MDCDKRAFENEIVVGVIMVKQGLVSIIIPVYNVEKYLHQCLDSVLRQSYQELEVVLVDDGSKDSSGKICDEYARKDNRFKVLHCENSGASAARNIGLNIAQGEYIYFLDSDDWLAENTIEALYSRAIEENADVVFFDAYTFDEKNGTKSNNNYSRKKKYCSQSGCEMMRELLENKEFRVSPCLIFSKKSLFETQSLRFEEGIMYEDMIMAYQIFSVAERVTQVQQFLYYRRYRINSVMTTKKGAKNIRSACVVYNRVRDFAIQKQIIDEEASQTYIARCAFNVINVYDAIPLKERKEFKQIYRTIKKQIIDDSAYGDKALYMRCYGRIPWFCYKVYEKSIGRFLKGSN